MRLGLTTEGAETPVRAARKEACERIRFAQLGRNSPTLDGRQMICGRGVDEWHEVRLPPSSFRAPRSGFPRFQWLTDLSTAPRIKCAPSPDRGIDNSALSAQMDLTLFVYTQLGCPVDGYVGGDITRVSYERLCQGCSPKANSILAAFTPCSYPHSDSTPWRRMPVKIRLQAATYATNSSVRMSKRSHRDGV